MHQVIIDQVLQHMHAEGIFPKHDIDFICDGRIHRFETEDDRYGKKSGAYFIHEDGYPNWGIMDYHKHDGMIKGKLDTQSLSWTEREHLREQQDTHHETRHEREIREAEQRRMEAQARKNAWGEYSRATHDNVDSHPYILRKKLGHTPKAIRIVAQPTIKDICHKGDLLIPMINAQTLQFQCLERITQSLGNNNTYMKGIYRGTHRKGACFIFPTPSKPPQQIIICEGFATGASILQFARHPSTVISASCWSNIINVAKAVREKSTLPIIIAADNDTVGIRGAVQTIEAGYADRYVTPPIEKYDWNDYLTRNL